jgi:hypothetical protein
MRKTLGLGLVAGVVGTGLIATSADGSLHRNSSIASRCVIVAGAEAPQLTGLQVFFKGQPVDRLVSGKKVKKYSIELTGSGLVPGYSVVVTSLRAFGFDGRQPQLQVAATFEGAMMLRAQFLAHAALRPGLLFIKLVNQEGVESNSLTAEVISKPSELSITSITPTSGPIGTRVSLEGVGFRPDATDGITALRFLRTGSDASATFAANFLEGFYIDSSSDGRTLEFVVPNNEILPICPGAAIGCDPLSIPQITSGLYRVSVINRAGMSQSVLFEVTASE